MSDAALPSLDNHTDVLETAASHVAEQGAKIGRCANCESSTIGPYCALCGQERDTHRRSVANLVKDFVVDIVNVDSRILRTIKALLFQPGELSCAFREGRTQRYIPAMRLYLFTSLLFFLSLSAFNIALMQLQVTAEKEKVVFDAKGNAFYKNPAYDGPEDLKDGIKPMIAVPKHDLDPKKPHYNYGTQMYFFQRIGAYHSALTREEAEKLLQGTVQMAKKNPTHQEEDWIEKNIFSALTKVAADPAALNGPLTTWTPRVLFLLLPAYALLLMLFYFRKRKDYYYVDHLVFSLNFHTFGFVLLLAAAIAAQFIHSEWVAWAVGLVAGLYLLFAMKRFYGQGWGWTSFKFLTIGFIYFCFLAAPAMAAVIALSVFGGSLG